VKTRQVRCSLVDQYLLRGGLSLVSASFSSTLMGEEIARRAYEIFQARGVPDGTELEDWLQAERDLLALIARGS
jgi:hypothetical protein